MNIKEKLTCNYCQDLFNHPITLICCNKNICKQHIDELLRESSSNQFDCPFCNQDNTNQNFNINEIIEDLIDMELHKFKLDPKYTITRDNMMIEIENLERILKDPENIIYEEISELKRQVDLDRESLKDEIDTLADGIIQQLESYEKEFKAEYKTNIVLEKYNELVESSRANLKEYEKCLNLFSVENNARNEKTNQIEKRVNILKSEIVQIKNELFSNLKINYEPQVKNRDGLFGRLIKNERNTKKKIKNRKEFLGNVKNELNGHKSCVFALLALENGDLVSAGSDKTIQIWDINSGKIKQTLSGHTNWIRDLKVVDKNRLISASQDSYIKIWSIANDTVSKTLTEHAGDVRNLALLPNGDLASASLDTAIKIWNINDGTVKRTLTGHTNVVYSLALLNNGDLASGSLDNTIRIWDVEAGTIKRTLTGHTSAVYSLIMLENGDLVSGSWDSTIKIWNTEDGTVRRTLTGHTDSVFTLKELANGDLVSGSADWTMKIWNVQDGSLKKSITANSSIFSLEVLENGDLVSGCGNGTIKIWE